MVFLVFRTKYLRGAKHGVGKQSEQVRTLCLPLFKNAGITLVDSARQRKTEIHLKEVDYGRSLLNIFVRTKQLSRRLNHWSNEVSACTIRPIWMYLLCTKAVLCFSLKSCVS